MYSSFRCGLYFLLSCLVLTLAGAAQDAAPAQESTTPPPVAVQTTQPSAVAERATTAPQGNGELIIGSGDLLEVSVYGAPEFTKQVRVADSGDVSLPLLGLVQVSGLSVRQAELLVQQRLSAGGFFNDPQVSIFEREYATQGISVLGEVQKPGIYPLLGSRKLYDAISAAGGVTPKSGNTITVTHRRQPKEPQSVVLPPNQTFPPQVNIDIFPGDTVVVSKAGIIYVVGDVHLPSGFVMENSRLTVLQAIAMAQGTNPTAKLDKTVLIRKDATGPHEIPIPLIQIMAAKAPDIQLQPDDVVFVPHSAGKAVARRSIEAVLQTLTGLAIYRPY